MTHDLCCHLQFYGSEIDNTLKAHWKSPEKSMIIFISRDKIVQVLYTVAQRKKKSNEPYHPEETNRINQSETYTVEIRYKGLEGTG